MKIKKPVQSKHRNQKPFFSPASKNLLSSPSAPNIQAKPAKPKSAKPKSAGQKSAPKNQSKPAPKAQKGNSFWEDFFTNNPFTALGRLFGSENYSKQELLDYLNYINTHKKIEDNYDSDNKARAIVAQTSTFNKYISLKTKEILIREMLQGATVGGDETAIIALLRSCTIKEKDTLVKSIGEATILDDFSGDNKKTVAAVIGIKAKHQANPAAAPKLNSQQATTNILSAAKASDTTKVSSLADAIKVIQLWGLTIPDIVKRLPNYSSSLSGKVKGKVSSTSIETKAQQLYAALTPLGKTTYQDMMTQVYKEPFWKDYMKNTTIYIFPNLGPSNRYGGYTQTGKSIVNGVEVPVHIIHISKDKLEKGEVGASAATLVHELSHTIHKNQSSQLLQPIKDSLVDILINESSIKALRAKAPNPAAAKQKQTNLIKQIIYERTSYAEAEIMVHLQQLTHQPSVGSGKSKISGSTYVRYIVEDYFNRLAKIQLPKAQLQQVVASLKQQTSALYNRRLDSLPINSPHRKSLETNKRLALLIIKLNQNRLNL